MSGLLPKISVIIPVYNTAEYLSTCLTGCLRQTLYDIEIICVNDGSKDDSGRILRAFAEEDHRVMIVNKPNGGPASARNAGIRNASGQMLVFLDSDDGLKPDACEKIWMETIETRADIITYGAEVFPDNPKAPKWYTDTVHTRKRRVRGFSPEVLIEETGSWPFVWGKAFKRSFLEEHTLLFNEDLSLGEDTVFLFEAFPHGRTFSFMPDKLYEYRWIRPGSIMSSAGSDIGEKRKKHLKIVDLICGYWKDRGWLDQYPRELLRWIIWFLIPPLPEKKNNEAGVPARSIMTEELAYVYAEEPPYSEEYLAGVKAVVDKYGMRKYIDGLPKNAKKRARSIL